MPTNDTVRAFIDGRETSPEIGQAIIELAANNAELAERIWTEPTPEEDRKVIARAWALADPAETELYWGQSTIRRGEQKL